MKQSLPSNWVKTTIGEITLDAQQHRPLPEEHFDYVDISSIDKDKKQINDTQSIAGNDSPSRARKIVLAGDVLVSMTRPNLNAVAVVPKELDGQIASTGFDVLRSIEVSPRWLYYIVRSESFISAMTKVAKGALYPAVRSKDIDSFEILLAPLNEQQRIIDKLDLSLERVDACRERLNRVPNILTRFRQAVLVAATSGKLTQDWRTDNQRQFNWQRVHLTDIGTVERGRSKHRPRNDARLYGGPYPFIQTGDIAQSGGYIISHTQTYSELGLAQSKLWPKETLCITIAANIANTAILSYPSCFPDSVVGFIANLQKSLPQLVKWMIDAIRDDLNTFAPATAQKNINLSILNELQFLCPPIEEQHEIVRRVEALFAYADRIEKRCQVVLSQVERLPQALFSKAFRGELVTQDPTDEPASILLERICETRARMITEVSKPRRSPIMKVDTVRQTPVEQEDIMQILRDAAKELSSHELFVAVGYPDDASSEIVEEFFVALRETLKDNQIVKVRRNNTDWFSATTSQAG